MHLTKYTFHIGTKSGPGVMAMFDQCNSATVVISMFHKSLCVCWVRVSKLGPSTHIWLTLRHWSDLVLTQLLSSRLLWVQDSGKPKYPNLWLRRCPFCFWMRRVIASFKLQGYLTARFLPHLTTSTIASKYIIHPCQSPNSQP
jgi:hypothetical protein